MWETRVHYFVFDGISPSVFPSSEDEFQQAVHCSSMHLGTEKDLAVRTKRQISSQCLDSSGCDQGSLFRGPV
jgi:hypothetical protein